MFYRFATVCTTVSCYLSNAADASDEDKIYKKQERFEKLQSDLQLIAVEELIIDTRIAYFKWTIKGFVIATVNNLKYVSID